MAYSKGASNFVVSIHFCSLNPSGLYRIKSKGLLADESDRSAVSTDPILKSDIHPAAKRRLDDQARLEGTFTDLERLPTLFTPSGKAGQYRCADPHFHFGSLASQESRGT